MAIPPRGLFDARVRLALEKAPSPEALPPFPQEYPADSAKWPDEALESAREAALRRLSAPR